MSTKKRRSLVEFACPMCKGIGTLRKILYGMPDPEKFDFEKYAVGGCCVREDGKDTDVRCRECGWEGFRKEIVDI